MRVGKTPPTILAASDAGAERILVVCPAIAVVHWRCEFERWWPKHTMPQKLDVVSYDRLRMEQAYYLDQRYDLLIVDECHYAKNPESQRTRLVYSKNGMAWRADRIWALSGTPAPRHAGELWPILRTFGVVGMTYDDFIRRYCDLNYLTGKPKWTKTKHIPELRDLLAKIMLRRKRKEVAPELPDIDFQFLEVGRYDGVDLPPMNPTESVEEYMGRYADSESRRDVAMSKVPALVEEITFNWTAGLLDKFTVFGWHVDPLVMLADSLRERGIRVGVINGTTTDTARQRIQQEFRSGKLDGVIANVLTAGTAIDLSTARHGYFLELDWTPGNNMQAANRMISMEKEDKVSIDVVTRPGTVDDRVQHKLLTIVRQLDKLY